MHLQHNYWKTFYCSGMYCRMLTLANTWIMRAVTNHETERNNFQLESGQTGQPAKIIHLKDILLCDFYVILHAFYYFITLTFMDFQEETFQEMKLFVESCLILTKI